jgi:hypothetical protein
MALSLAAVLSVGGSVGLHAEPVTQAGPRPVNVTGASASASDVSAAHSCLICALYGSAFPSWCAFVAQGILPSLGGVPIRLQWHPVSPATPCHNGRAPPSFL